MSFTLFESGGLVKGVSMFLETQFTSEDDLLEQKHEQLKAERDYERHVDSIGMFLDTMFASEKDRAIEQKRNTNSQKIASTSSLFIAGWRPAIGWTGVMALAYQFVIYPMLLWLGVESAPPQMEAEMLYPIITGMLGIAGLRSYDKIKKTDTKGMR